MINHRARMVGKFIMAAILVFVMAIVSLPGFAKAHESAEVLKDCWQYAEDFLLRLEWSGYDTTCVVFFEPDEYDNLAIEQRENQNALYVEVVCGVKQNNQGDGKVLNTSDGFYNYIAYSEYEPEEIMVYSFELYNPENNYCDDIIERYDYWESDGTSHLLRHA